MSHSKWNAVNTPAGQKLDEEIIGKMTQAVHMHYKIPTHADREENLKPEPITDPVASDILDAVLSTLDVFIWSPARWPQRVSLSWRKKKNLSMARARRSLQ